MNSIQEVSESTLKLESFLKTVEPGTELTYEQIEKESGVKMDSYGKSYLRRALRRLKVEALSKRGTGIVIASEKTVSTILIHQIVKIDNTVKRGERVYNNLNEGFYNKLNAEEKKQINFIGAAFGAIRLAAQNGRKVLKNKNFGNIPMLPERQ